MSRATHKVLAAVGAAVVLGVASSSASVYSNLMAEFSKYDHRLPGSENFDRCFEAVKSELEKAGLTPHVQTFDAMVPRTQWCRFTVDGAEVGPVYPVNGGLMPLVTGGEISAPLLWLGDGSLDALDGKDVEGCIAVLDLGAPGVTFEHVFPHGARAVILVGSEQASQWSILRVCERGPTMVPRVYIDRATAEAAGLLSADGVKATLDARADFKDTIARNLWVELPGEEGATFALDAEEVAVLSARLDTYGFVPDFTPDLRYAANAALLADVVCALADKPRKRALIAVFFGAHYGAQEGSRHFYYAVRKSDDISAGFDYSLALREEKYERMRQKTIAATERLDRMDILDAADDDMFRLSVSLKSRLVGWINNLNSDLREVLLEQRELDREAGRLRKAGDIVHAERVEARSAVLVKQQDVLKAEKARYNDMRRQINDRRLDDDEQSLRTYRELTEYVKRFNLLREAELKRQIAHNRTFRELAARFTGKALVGHFDFDFADSRRPWCLGVSGATRFFLHGNAAGTGVTQASYLPHFSEIRKVYADLSARRGGNSQAPLFGPALDGTFKPFSLCFPGSRSIPSAVALSVGAAGFQMLTVGDPLDGDALPVRRPSDLSGMKAEITSFVGALANRREFSLRGPVPRMKIDPGLMTILREERDPRKGDLAYGLMIASLCKGGSAESEGSVSNAVAYLSESVQGGPRGPGEVMGGQPGITRYPVMRVLSDGRVFSPSLADNSYTALMALLHGPSGHVERIGSGGSPASHGATLVYAIVGGNVVFGFAPDLLGTGEMDSPVLLDAKTDAAPTGIATPIKLSWVSTIYGAPKSGFKRLGSMGELLTGATEDSPRGEGIPYEGLLYRDTVFQGAHDYWLLNESRLQALRQRNIINDPLESLHAEAREHLDEAEIAREAKNHKAARGHAIFATCLENRAYRPVQGVSEDLVRAVIVLLLLNLPFAFAMERLLFGFTSIYKQVLGFAGFFAVTFGILYFTHPAFAMAQRPIVILLAFVILSLGIMTLRLVLGKIRLEIRAMQGLGSTVHGRDGDSNTALAAVLIGISGMRNRPLKTFLTSMTVILLTFTILAFASFTAELGVVETYLGQGRDEDRIELHRASCLDIPGDLTQAIGELYGDRFHVLKRGGIFRNPVRPEFQGAAQQAPERMILHPGSGKVVRMEAFLGLDPEETRHSAKIAELVPGITSDEWPHPPVYLPPSVTERLGVRKGDDLLVMGRRFTFAGAFNAAKVQAATTIDNIKIVPPDFTRTVTRLRKGMSLDSAMGTARPVQMLEGLDLGRFEWTPPEKLAICGLDAMQRAFPMLTYETFVVLYPRSGDVDVEKAARALATVFQGSVHVKSSGGAKKMHYTKAVAGSGFGDVLVPLLLGGLIIFSSLLGSIVDREREIFTYSALGLSPPSVAALFFAESGVYSVVGGMGGYLVSQVVAKGLIFCGQQGWFTPPNLNFSSLTSVLTILVVMAVVMLSTVVPAIKAGKSANPGVARAWRMPLPEGDRLDFVFPFTVSELDFNGILSFIREHFENHADATLGMFSARDVSLFEKDNRYGIQAEIALAPFDLGIFQKFRMYSKEFEIKGIDEVVVEIERIGGTRNSWFRANRAFADELRQQFLLWRSLPIETVMHYRKQTEELLGEGSNDGSATA